MNQAEGDERFGWRGLAASLLLFVVAAGHLVVATPVFEAPDENGHAQNVGHLLRSGEAPIVLGSSELAGLPGWRESALGHHPTLYYRILARTLHLMGHRDLMLHAQVTPFGQRARFQHGRDELGPGSLTVRRIRALRAFSVLCGLVALVAIHGCLRQAAPRAPLVAFVGTLSVASNGGWQRTFAVLDNGNLAVALTCLLAWLLAWSARRGVLSWQVGLLAGLLAGAALQTKLTAILGPGLIVVAAALVLRRSERRAACLVAAGLALTVAGLVWMPWVLRNLELYGEPLATAVHEAAYAGSMLPAEVRWQHLTQQLPVHVFWSAVGPVGWAAQPPTLGLHVAAGLLGLAALAGWSRARGRLGLELAPTVVLAALGLAAVALFVRFNLVFTQAQARYLYSGAPAAALLIGGGAAAWGRSRPKALVGAAWAAALGLTISFAWGTREAWRGALDSERERPIASLDLNCVPENPGLPAPVIDSSLDPPVVRWDPGVSRWSMCLWTEEGARFGGTFESLGLALDSGAEPIPEAVWNYLEPGAELILVLRSIPDDESAPASAGPAGPRQVTAPARVRR